MDDIGRDAEVDPNPGLCVCNTGSSVRAGFPWVTGQDLLAERQTKGICLKNSKPQATIRGHAE